MTLGEKIRESRRKCGLSQKQLGERMAVSRSAIAKWETGKGLPDVGNLKVLARLLHVSVDDLLDESETDQGVIRESYKLASYGYGCRKMQKDRLIREKFPDADIYTLLGRQETASPDQWADTAPGCGSIHQNRIKNPDKAFYLIEKADHQLFVTVTDTHVEIRPLGQPLRGNRFSLDGWDFVKCNY